MTIGDVNDNPPQFHGRPYSTRIREDAPVGQPLDIDIRITDPDLGRNSDITVLCEREDGKECDTFKVHTERISDGEYEVKLEIAKNLDHETRAAHVLTLRANDNGERRLSVAASVAIDVLDVQDQPPIFSNAPYSATLVENTPEGTSVLKISAQDGDAGGDEPQRAIELRIEEDKLGYFQLRDEGNGKATLLTSETPADRENSLVQQAGGVYSFQIVAEEISSDGLPTGEETRAPVTVVITDADDQFPKFSSTEYEASVWENAAIGSQVPGLALTVNDEDAGLNARYHLRLEDAPNSPGASLAFEVSPQQGEGRTPLLIRVANPELLDYEQGIRLLEFDVVASAKPNGTPLAIAIIRLNVMDANDHAPTFSRSSFRFRVPENAAVGQRVDPETNPLVAIDEDSGEFGELRYALRGFGAGAFATDPETGGIHVVTPLDYEKQPAYSLALEARDGGGRVTQVSVNVEIEDVNDNTPQFDSMEYSRVVREGAKTFDPQMFVRATDADGPRQGGGKITYSLEEDEQVISSTFTVDAETGEVRMKKEAHASDTLNGQYEFRVRATDHGFPPLHNLTRILIRVGLAGNQRPTWRGAENGRLFHADVPETAPSETLVTKINAHDPDGPDSLVRYRIAGGGEDNFLLDEVSGEIRVSPEARLDLDVGSPLYDVLVVAVDGGPGPVRETATATVRVTITDINNKPPKFPLQNTTGYVSERAALGYVIMRVSATDPDAGALLRYSLGDIRALDSAGLPVRSASTYNYKSAVQINETTGELNVSGPLDHQSASVLLIQVRAEDTAAPPGTNQIATTDVTIYVQAYEDDSPVFLNEGWTRSRPEIRTSLDEEKPIGTRVLELKARDPRSGLTTMRYQVVHSDTDTLTVVPNGELIITKRLDYEQLDNKQLSLTVEAIGIDGRSATSRISIQVVDLNDNSPEFDKEVYEASVLESARYPVIVTTVKAIDLDAANREEEIARGYGVVTYSLSGGGNAGLFTIDTNKGDIQVSVQYIVWLPIHRNVSRFWNVSNFDNTFIQSYTMLFHTIMELLINLRTKFKFRYYIAG